MSKSDLKTFGFFFVICGFILCPLVTFPLSGDLALFQSVAKILNNGGIPYQNFVDIKPPILFYFFEFLTDIFGNGEYCIRWFDFIVQLLTVSLLYFAIFHSSKHMLPAAAAGILYSIAYVAMNYTDTTQIESFFGLALALILWIYVFYPENLILWFIVAMLAGFFTGMKYTLGIVLPVLFLDDILFSAFRHRSRFLLKKYIWIVAGFTFAFCLTLLPYCDEKVLAGYNYLQPYFASYISGSAISGTLIKIMFDNVVTYFADMQSVSMLLLFACGTYFLMKNRADNDGFFALLRLCFLLTFGLYFSCLVERKLFIYHLSRANVPFYTLCGTGIFALFGFLKSSFKKDKCFSCIVFVSMGILLLPLSPLPRLMQRLSIPYLFFTNRSAYDNCYTINGDPVIIRSEHKEVADFINRHTDSDDLVITATTGGGYINYLLKTPLLSKFCQSSYYIYPNADKRYIDDFVKELKKCKFLLVQKNDRNFPVNRTFASTYESLEEKPEFKKTIDSLLMPVKETNSFVIFASKEQNRK